MTENDLKINLEELNHQREAVEAIVNNFPEIDLFSKYDKNGLPSEYLHANPLIKNAFDENHFIDIKMETGTGKTYTYTRMMYELHERFGMYKFIIVVPSSAIKEGVKSFLTADYARQHFSKFFPKVDLFGNVDSIDAGAFSGKKGRKAVPNAIREFVEADLNNKNQIRVMLINDKGFLDRNDSSMFKNDYDVNLFGGESSPAAMISKTRPIIIIDEPHRLKREKSSYKNIIKNLKPEMIIRFGATFPIKNYVNEKDKVFKNQNKDLSLTPIFDYFRKEPQYNLNAVDAFNRDLVKGIAVYIPENASSGDAYKVIKATKDELELKKNNQYYKIKVGELLSEVDERFQGGLTYVSKGLLSNELEVGNGTKLIADTFTNSYQEVLIEQALEAHFITERENFLRDGYQIKTNALFFIDNIDSYRDRGTGQSTWLKDTFEKLLKNKLKDLIEHETNEEYKLFLIATIENLDKAHGGYFSSDSKAKHTDDKIIEQTNVILRNKGKSLRLKDNEGNWNVLRFFFSQWTLREGWDNPNVFTIAKLRSSGSESSKIQEIGRGLRLPVDIKGNRLSNQQWWLNFIIDESEKDFTDKLLKEINAEISSKEFEKEIISDDLIFRLKNIGYGKTRREIFNNLYDSNIIDDNDKVIDVSSLKRLLSENLYSSKIRNGKREAPPKVKLVKKNWSQIKEFWNSVSRKYMISFDDISEKDLLKLFESVIKDDGLFDNNKDVIIEVNQTNKGKNIKIVKSYKSSKNTGEIGKLNYYQFVKRISNQTNLPVLLIHKAFRKRLEKINDIDKIINEKTVAKIVNSWTIKFEEVYATKYHYDALDFSAKSSIMKNGEFVDDIAQGDLGMLEIDVKKDERNLFEKVFVDSNIPEGEIAEIIPNDEIKVFGKLPRRAIQVPTYTGGTTTPDFIFATKNNLFLLIEAKSESIRESELIAINSQKNLFEKFKDVQWSKVTKKEQVIDLLNQFNHRK